MARSAAVTLVALAAACGGDGGDEASERRDRGDVVVRWEDNEIEEAEAYAQALREEELLEQLAAGLNESLRLPRDLPVNHANCGEANAFYDPNTGELTMCYELLATIAASASELSGEEQALQVVGTWVFVFFHELGHALVDLYELPVTGGEEDAVDQFSTVLLLEEGEGAAFAIAAAQFWRSLGTQELNELQFADEHPLSQQRFYNILCLVYGSDPQAYDALVTNGHLPESRAVRCPAEYQSARNAWATLLEPWIKE